jgi:alpha-ketoglutarate-dependent taurine dioxygenase
MIDLASAVNQEQFPAIVDMQGVTSGEFIDFYLSNKRALEELLHAKGAIKFDNVSIDDIDVFQQIVDSIGDEFMDYVDGNSPRTKLSGNVYTSTEFAKTETITMHNELSYSAKWPRKLFLSCIIPSETGGSTLLADSREILKQIDPKLVAEIKERGIVYIRNLHSGAGMGPSWQSTFETTDKATVEAYCKARSIEFEWGEDDNLRVKQYSMGIKSHHTTGEEVWFNQIDQFHPVQLGEATHMAFQALFETPDDYPLYVRFADGKEIADEVIESVLAAIEKVTIAPKWEKNQLLIVDNELSAHGREPFTGDRKVVVAMSA